MLLSTTTKKFRKGVLTFIVTDTCKCTNLLSSQVCKVGSVWFGNGSTYSDEVCDNIVTGRYREAQEDIQVCVRRSMKSKCSQSFHVNPSVSCLMLAVPGV